MSTRIAPSADVSEQAVIGEGSSIWHLAQVRERAVLGAGCIVGRGAYIGEGARLGDNCKVSSTSRPAWATACSSDPPSC